MGKLHHSPFWDVRPIWPIPFLGFFTMVYVDKLMKPSSLSFMCIAIRNLKLICDFQETAHEKNEKYNEGKSGAVSMRLIFFGVWTLQKPMYNVIILKLCRFQVSAFRAENQLMG